MIQPEYLGEEEEGGSIYGYTAKQLEAEILKERERCIKEVYNHFYAGDFQWIGRGAECIDSIMKG